jgi:ferredoxin
MSRPIWFVQLLKKAFPNRYLAARATRVPILGELLNRWLFEGDDLFFMPSRRAIQINENVTNPDEVVLPSEVVEHFIQQAKVHWIMTSCICRQGDHCKRYPVDRGCLFLGEAALGINPQLGRRVTKAQALNHVEQCREAGLIHLVGRNKLDTVWLGVGPGEKLLTICNCCPCCCLWRVVPHIAPHIHAKITRMPGVSVAISDRCEGCGTCTDDVCFVDALHLLDGRATIAETCKGCGRCVTVCPEGAIELTILSDSFTQAAISRISQVVDVS